jgi:hypothetical protein
MELESLAAEAVGIVEGERDEAGSFVNFDVHGDAAGIAEAAGPGAGEDGKIASVEMQENGEVDWPSSEGHLQKASLSGIASEAGDQPHLIWAGLNEEVETDRQS